MYKSKLETKKIRADLKLINGKNSVRLGNKANNSKHSSSRFTINLNIRSRVKLDSFFSSVRTAPASTNRHSEEPLTNYICCWKLKRYASNIHCWHKHLRRLIITSPGRWKKILPIKLLLNRSMCTILLDFNLRI